MSKALIVVDVQNDFCEGGSLAVEGGAQVAADITEHIIASEDYEFVVATKDWHMDPGDHFGDPPDFKDSWPAHCRAGTDGAAFHPNLDRGLLDDVFRKGTHAAAYSGFEGFNDEGTTLYGYLIAREVTELDVVGIATDYCVKATVLDALKAGRFQVRVLKDLTVAVGDKNAALLEMREAGAEIVRA